MRRLPLLGCVIVLGFTATLWPAAAAAATCRRDSGPSLAGQNVRSEQLQQASLACADLRGLDLHGVDLAQANLSGADLTGANLAGASLSQADLTGAVLARVDAVHADFGQAVLTGATLTGIDAHAADFTQATLTGADLSGADLTGATLDQAQANDARLDGAHLAGASLIQVGASGATARDATGLLPADGLGGIAATVIAWFALWRWWRGPGRRADAVQRRITPGRIVAGAVAAVMVVGFVAAVIGARGLVAAPTFGTWLSLLPFAFLFAIGAVGVLSSVRRVRGPIVAAGLTVVGAAGVYLLCAAGVAGALEGMEVTAFANSSGGVTRGWAGVGLGLVLLVAMFVVARLPGVTRQGSGLVFAPAHPTSDEVWY